MWANNNETLTHLFLHCPVAWMLSMKHFLVLGEQWVYPNFLKDHLLTKFGWLGWLKGGKVPWRCAMFALIWIFSNERNSQISQDVQDSFPLNWDKIVFLASFWCSITGAFRSVSLVDIQRDWKLCWLNSVLVLVFISVYTEGFLITLLRIYFSDSINKILDFA